MYGYIYETTNIINGRKYVGKCKSDVFLGNKYLGSGRILNEAIKKYGKDTFIVKYIDEADSLEELNKKEKYYIKLFNAVESSEYYNIALGGDGGILWSSKENHPSTHTDRRGNKNPCYGKRWYTDGEQNIYLYSHEEIPANFYKGYTRKSAFGRITIYKSDVRKSIKPEELDFYIKDGWITSSERNSLLKKDAELKKIENKKIKESLKREQLEKKKAETSKAAKVSPRRGKKLLHKDNNIAYVSLDDIKMYLDNGWLLGEPIGFKKHSDKRRGWHQTERQKRIASITHSKKIISESQKEKLRNTVKNRTSEDQQLISNHYREGQLNLCWVVNENGCIRIHKDELDKYLSLGYIRGRKFKQ